MLSTTEGFATGPERVQRCGTCSHYTETGRNVGYCHAPIPPMSSLPNLSEGHVNGLRSIIGTGVFKVQPYDGEHCPLWKTK